MTLTFWTVAFWYVVSTGAPEPDRSAGAWRWGAAVLVVAVFSVGSARLAAGSLRVPVRAQRVGWPYAYGLYPPERDDAGREFRWTTRHAVAVVDVEGPWIDVRVSVNHPNLAAHPVHARVWCDGSLLVDAVLTDGEPVVRGVGLPESEKRVLIEASASRTARPDGMADDRELGLMLGWTFTDGPAR